MGENIDKNPQNNTLKTKAKQRNNRGNAGSHFQPAFSLVVTMRHQLRRRAGSGDGVGSIRAIGRTVNYRKH